MLNNILWQINRFSSIIKRFVNLLLIMTSGKLKVMHGVGFIYLFGYQFVIKKRLFHISETTYIGF